MKILPEYIAKIEGHGHLECDLTKNKVKLVVTEGERLFEQLLVGRKFSDGPFIVSRICGICPTAHYLASLKAIEKALNISVSEDTKILRKIMAAAQIIQSHNLHLNFLALPDYLGLNSASQIAQKYPAEFSQALMIKKTVDEILTTISGRSIHPISPILGGFTQIPDKAKIDNARFQVEKALNAAWQQAFLFFNFEYPSIEKTTEYLALWSKNYYAYYSGIIKSTFGPIFEPADYQKEIEEQVRTDSSAKFGLRNKSGFMVGAIARIILSDNHLHPRAKNLLENSGITFEAFNPFNNLLSQSIEIVHFLEEIQELLSKITHPRTLDVEVMPYKIKAGEGVGAIEAPRGTLYHHYKIDSEGKITYLNIVTPTVQNLTNIQEDAQKLLEKNKSKSAKEKKRLLEMLVRAYDPCITCAVH